MSAPAGAAAPVGEASSPGAAAPGAVSPGAAAPDSPRASPSASGIERDPRLSRLLVVCLCVGFTTLLDQSILTVAVPALRGSLAASTTQIQWMLAAFSLAFAVALVPAGRLGDAFGRKALLVGGVGMFSLLSVVAATATSADVVVLARLLQGAAAGTANPQVIGLIQDHFSGPARTRALGGYATVAAFSGIIAPLLGGAILSLGGHDDAWRLVVALNIPFGLATVVLALRWVPTGRPLGSPGVGGTVPPADSGPVPSVDGGPVHGASATGRAPRACGRVPDVLRRSRGDVVGLVLLVVATLALLVPVVAVSGATTWQVPAWAYASLGGSVAVTALFGWWERRLHRAGGSPVLLPQLLRSRGFVLGTLVATFWFGSMLGVSLVLMLFLQEGVGLSAFHAGLVTTPGALASGICSALSWRLVARYGRSAVTLGLVGVGLSLLATIAVVLWAPVAGVVVGLTLAQVVTGVAGGLAQAPNQYLTLEHAPPGANGVAAAFLQVTQRISATLCFAALSGIVLGATVPGDLASARSAAGAGLWLTTALMAAATACSVLAQRGERVSRER